MKYLSLLFIILIFNTCQAQQKELLLERTLDASYIPPIPGMEGILDSIEVYDITYLSNGLKVKGLLAKPKKEGTYPCIIYNRGGNRDFGALNKRNGVWQFGKLAEAGYVVIASQYRGNGGGEGQEEFGGKDVDDVLVLTEVLKEIEAADTSRIGMYGWSRGGMMTYIALPQTDKIKVAVVGAANSDLTLIDRPNMEKRVYAELIPDYEQNKEVELKKRSAIYWVDQFPKNVPILMLHGSSDWRVKSTHSLKLALEFEKHRIPYRLKIFEGADHGISEFRTEVEEEVLSWFNRYLRDGEVLPEMEFHGR